MADEPARDAAEKTDRAAAERLAFFSDAVVAIAITLLALGLPLPNGETNAALLRSALENGYDYLAFVVSFVVISVHWRGHHRVFRYLTAAPPQVIQWNMVWLMFVVLTPFATRVLTEPGGFEVRFTFYAAVQALTAAAMLASVRAMTRRRLLDPGVPPDVVAGLGAVCIAFLVSIPVAFFTPWAYICWALGPPLGGLLQRWRRKTVYSGRRRG